MLDREDDAALAQIEAALRREDPAFVSLLEGLVLDPLGIADAAAATPTEHRRQTNGPEPTPGPSRNESTSNRPEWPPASLPARVFRQPGEPWELPSPRPRQGLRTWTMTVVVMLAALLVTLAAAVLFGPNAGGLIGVTAITAATMYGYQRHQGCPGAR